LTIEQLNQRNPGILNNAQVLVRVDFNVPQKFVLFSSLFPSLTRLGSKKDGTITDDTRIREALPTINYLIKGGAKVVLSSHCGRPDGKVNPKYSLAPMAARLSELLSKPLSSLLSFFLPSLSPEKPVAMAEDCIGEKVDAAVAQLKGGDVLMLENARFYKEEEKNDPEFARKLAKGASIYVNDAFGTAHRAHASTAGVAPYVQHRVAGFLMEKEIRFLHSAIAAPLRPFAAIVGGAKVRRLPPDPTLPALLSHLLRQVSTKIPVIESLIEKCDKIFIGGGMIFTFYRAMGLEVGTSMVEEDFIPLAKTLLEKARAKGVQFYLPEDVVVADEFKADANSQTVDVKAMPAGWMGLDIGPKSIATFRQQLSDCKTVVWNGPMGVFEFDKFAAGTTSVAQTLADLTSGGTVTIIGGGDSVAAVHKAGLQSKMSHISTGGGASLEMLEGKVLPGVAALDDA
jgi:phosphoglycerate kinase